MFRWIPYTFVRIILFFVTGTLVGIHSPDALQENLGRGILVFLIALFIVHYFFSRRRRLFNPGVIGLLAVFMLGYLHTISRTESRNPDHLRHALDGIEYYQVVITSYAEERARSWRQRAEVKAVCDAQWEPRMGKVMLYFSKEDFEVPFQYGDHLIIRGHPAEVQPPPNPGEFDYRRFLSFRNIYHQHFLRAGDLRLTHSDPPSRLLALTIKARFWATQVIARHVTGARERATAQALVLGVTDGLDNELLEAYAATGAMHVLAVSGLHVSILYMIIVVLLKPLKKSKTGRWILALTALFLLWGYAFVTGLSASVLRAVMMFSFVALARPAGLHTNIYNTLASSAFCLLLIDPFLIMSVGFQLSYLAVLSIVYLHPRLFRLWEAPDAFTNSVWQVVSVSVAAQAGTFVPGLFYFNQFPNYFLLANLVVIPVSFVVLVSGVALLGVCMVPGLSHVTGWILTLSAKLLNQGVFVIEAFPFSVTENIYISFTQSIALAGLILSFILLAEYKRFRYVWAALVFTVLLVCFQWRHYHDHIQGKKLTVYQVRNHTAIDWFDGGRAWFFSDSVLAAQPEKISYHIQPHRTRAGIRAVTDNTASFAKAFKGGVLISRDGILVAWLNGDHDLPHEVRPDLFVISNNAVKDFRKFGEQYPDAQVVLDSSNGYYYTTNFLAALGDTRRVHSVLHAGAFEMVVDEPMK